MIRASWLWMLRRRLESAARDSRDVSGAVAQIAAVQSDPARELLFDLATNHPNESVRGAALRFIGPSLSLPQRERLAALLGHGNIGQVERALAVVHKVRERSLLPAILRRLIDSPLPNRSRAYELVWGIDPAWREGEALARAVADNPQAALKSADSAIALRAAEWLAKQEGPSAIPLLVDRIGSCRDAELLRGLAASLSAVDARWQSSDVARDALRKAWENATPDEPYQCLSARNQRLTLAVIEALTSAATPDVAPDLLRWMGCLPPVAAVGPVVGCLDSISPGWRASQPAADLVARLIDVVDGRDESTSRENAARLANEVDPGWEQRRPVELLATKVAEEWPRPQDNDRQYRVESSALVPGWIAMDWIGEVQHGDGFARLQGWRLVGSKALVARVLRAAALVRPADAAWWAALAVAIERLPALGAAGEMRSVNVRPIPQ